VAWGAVAADWGVLPEGTRIELSCYPGQVFTVLDTGSAIQGRRIDIWQRDHETAREFGRQHIKVWILGPHEAAAHSRAPAARASRRVRAPGAATDLAALGDPPGSDPSRTEACLRMRVSAGRAF
jgi:hypothetical protein